ncbi:MAG: hypothetical protein MEP57_03650 [Microvirga sp.]|nr:hypothetical protein [Microvirga sp.]
MDRIGQLAALSVLRATGFATLAIGLAMATLAFDPALSLQVGGIFFLLLAVVMDYRARVYPRKRRIRESEVWIMLADDQRPPEALARRLIVPAMQRELREKGLWVASVSAACLGLSVLTTLTGVA